MMPPSEKTFGKRDKGLRDEIEANEDWPVWVNLKIRAGADLNGR